MTTPLQQKMIEDMQLRGLTVRTQESYLLAVRQLARHYQKSPDQISEEELRQYFLFLKNNKHAARSTCTINLCGIKFFFQHTRGREWKTFEFVHPPRGKWWWRWNRSGRSADESVQSDYTLSFRRW